MTRREQFAALGNLEDLQRSVHCDHDSDPLTLEVACILADAHARLDRLLHPDTTPAQAPFGGRMPRYRVTKHEISFIDIDCANAEQAVEIAFASDTPEWRWSPSGDDATHVRVSELGPSEHDAEAEREARQALDAMHASARLGVA